MKSIRLDAGLFLGALLLAPLSLLAQTTTTAGKSAAADHADHDKSGHRGMHRGMRHGGLERFDTDNDGRISRSEFATGQAEMTKRKAEHARRADKPQRAPLDFAAIDSNGDGYLVRTELRAHHERMRPQHEAERKARFDARFAEADLNRDGKLSRVEVGEKMPRMADRFAWMDDNRDGFLSQAELQSSRDKR